MESNGGLEGVIGGQQRLVEQAGNLIEQAIQLERVRLEAEQAKRNVQEVRASQLTSAVAPQTPQAPLSGGYTGIRDMCGDRLRH